jgi:hypothetical protein
MEGDGKTAAEEKGREEGGERRGNACCTFVKNNGRTEDGLRKEWSRRRKRPGCPAHRVRPR